MAGLIPQSFIDDVIDRADIVEVIEGRVKLRRSGSNHMGLCPFHKEKSPSFSVNQDKQFYYCFGCGASGNVLSFLLDHDRMDFPTAVEYLAGQMGMQVPRDETQRDSLQRQQKLGIYDFLEKTALYYAEQLRKHPERNIVIEYLKGRELSGQIAKMYGMGYAPAGWENLLQQFADEDESRKMLLDSGLIIERKEGKEGHYDRFRQRVMFPIRDQRGRVVAFGGRVLNDEKPKYLNSPETPVFHKSHELYGLYEARKQTRKLTQLIIVEGYMDVVALAQLGITWAVATLGTATSDDHLQRIFRVVPELVFCFDGDAAGLRAARKALEVALPHMEDGREARFLFLPEGEDPDSMVRSEGKDAFLERIQEAAPLSRYFYQALSEDIDIHSMDGRARLSKRAIPMLQKIPHGVFRQLMEQELARITGLESASVHSLVAQADAAVAQAEQVEQQQVQEQAPQPAFTPPMSAHPVRRRPRRIAGAAIGSVVQPAARAVSLLLQDPELAKHIDDIGALKTSADEDIRLFLDIVELLEIDPHMSAGMMLTHWWDTPEGERLKELVIQDFITPPEGLESEFTDTMRHLYRRPQADELKALMDKARQLPLTTDEKHRLRELLSATARK